MVIIEISFWKGHINRKHHVKLRHCSNMYMPICRPANHYERINKNSPSLTGFGVNFNLVLMSEIALAFSFFWSDWLYSFLLSIISFWDCQMLFGGCFFLGGTIILALLGGGAHSLLRKGHWWWLVGLFCLSGHNSLWWCNRYCMPFGIFADSGSVDLGVFCEVEPMVPIWQCIFPNS